MRRLKPIPNALRLLSITFLNALVLVVIVPASRGMAQTNLGQLMDSLTTSRHCSEIRGNVANDSLFCQVWDGLPERFSEPLQIDIYRKEQRPQTIEPGGPIREWHLWNHDKSLAIHFGAQDTDGTYALYDTATGSLIETVSGNSELSQLPEWAKSRSQLEDESVPEGSAFMQQRTQWIAKVLRRVQSIHPGMKRKDIDLILTTEGGLSTRFQRSYVSRECIYIKVDIRFSAAAGNTDFFGESPEDVIDSISRPYLAWSVFD